MRDKKIKEIGLDVQCQGEAWTLDMEYVEPVKQHWVEDIITNAVQSCAVVGLSYWSKMHSNVLDESISLCFVSFRWGFDTIVFNHDFILSSQKHAWVVSHEVVLYKFMIFVS